MWFGALWNRILVWWLRKRFGRRYCHQLHGWIEEDVRSVDVHTGLLEII